MDQFTVLVDAGYVYGAGGQLLFGTTDRSMLYLDASRFNTLLVERCRQHTAGLRYLRTYWYDGARDATPTPTHIAISSQPRIKLRLGRLTLHGQKGVDSRIVRDLITLSRERAVHTIFLVSGDDDLREGVSEAQDVGVAVVLVGIEPLTGEANQSQSLIREADDHIVLRKAELATFLSQRTPAPNQASSPSSVAEDPLAIGQGFAKGLEKDQSLIERLQKEAPRIPMDLDQRLLQEAEKRLGSLQGKEELRRLLRRGFWQGIKG